MIYSRMLGEIEKHVSHLFKTHQTRHHLFHNLEQTCQLVSYTREIASSIKLNEEDGFVLQAAAWFQYTGWLFVNDDSRTEKSAGIMRSYFTSKQTVSPDLVSKTEALIQFTAFTRSPANKLEEVLHDANTYYFGTDDFRHQRKNLRKELQLLGSNRDPDWKQNTLAFLQQHNYFTQYCRQRLERKKIENIKQLMTHMKDREASLPLEDEKKQQANQVKSVQTLMRVMNDNHIEFSTIADNKANLLISVNAIMISVILSVLVRRLESDSRLVVPTILFLSVAVTTIVLSILSTKPKVTSGFFTRDDVLNRRINLMFFGNFHKTNVEDYEWGMKKLMSDPDYVYTTMVRDLHQLGVVLAKKYRLISAAYLVFMYGIIVTIIAFIIAILVDPPFAGVPIAT